MNVRDVWYALMVCKKYKLILNPFTGLDEGSYRCGTKVVTANPFDKNFISIFMHEVGHHLHDKRVDLPSYLKAQGDELRFGNGRLRGENIYRVLDSEGIASRYAVKSGKGDSKYLNKCFNTYSATVFSNLTKPVVVNEISDIIDCVYRNNKRIS